MINFKLGIGIDIVEHQTTKVKCLVDLVVHIVPTEKIVDIDQNIEETNRVPKMKVVVAEVFRATENLPVQLSLLIQTTNGTKSNEDKTNQLAIVLSSKRLS